MTNTQRQENSLLFLGLILFMLGLTIGLFVHNMQNPRMALSAHIEGLMNGLFLMVLGLLWKRIILSPRLLSLTFWLFVYGTFANVVAVVVAAITGFGKMMPIAGGQDGKGAIENVISFLLISLALSMLIGCLLTIVGFLRYMNQKSGVKASSISE